MDRRILVADDDDGLAQVCADILALEGFQVEVAHDGGEALHKLHSDGEVSALLVDLMMPVMNGVELCRHLKDDPELRETPVIMMSAHPQVREIAQNCADAVITKPFDIDDLLTTIGRFVQTA